MKSSKAQSKLHVSIYLDKTKLWSSTRCTSPFCLAHPSIFRQRFRKRIAFKPRHACTYSTSLLVVEYIATPFTCASAHAEPDTRAIVGKIRGSWSPFWGGVRPPPYNYYPIDTPAKIVDVELTEQHRK
eukprot:scaffold158655_cov79-Cyclotella_meneghiniana.AAC.1